MGLLKILQAAFMIRIELFKHPELENDLKKLKESHDNLKRLTDDFRKRYPDSHLIKAQRKRDGK